MAAKLNIGYPKLTPDSSSSAPETNLQLPKIDDFIATWHLVTSSSSFWHDKFAINVTHSNLKSTATSDSWDNLTSYRTRGSDKPGSAKGVDSTEKSGAPGQFQWRGTGFLRMISLRWEVLGFGEAADGVKWFVSFAQKTMFTPQSLNLYCDKVDGVSHEEAERILAAIRELGNETLNKELDMMRLAESA